MYFRLGTVKQQLNSPKTCYNTVQDRLGEIALHRLYQSSARLQENQQKKIGKENKKNQLVEEN